MKSEGPGAETPRHEDDASLIERAAARLAAEAKPVAVPVVRPSPTTGSASTRSHAAPGPGTCVTLNPRVLAVNGLIAPSGPPSDTAEQFRMIGHQLRRRARDQGGGRATLVMVTSPKSGDGKTFVAVNLALALASQGDVEVVLVDADVTRPSVASRLGIAAETGLRGYLADPAVALADVLLATDLPGLQVLPGGPSVRGNLDFGRRLQGLLAALASTRGDRVVLIDTQPALAGSVPHLLAPLVDQVIVVAAAEETESAAVGETLERLDDHAAKLTLVFNKSGGALQNLIGTAGTYRGAAA